VYVCGCVVVCMCALISIVLHVYYGNVCVCENVVMNVCFLCICAQYVCLYPCNINGQVYAVAGCVVLIEAVL
jgi:hypothetical protein